MHEIWNRVSKQAYMETIHPLVILNLYAGPAPKKSLAAFATVLLIGSSEELGVPPTYNSLGSIESAVLSIVIVKELKVLII